MKLVVDLLPLQTLSSSERGIGRYTYSLTKNILQINDKHDIVLLLNADKPETTRAVREKLVKYVEPAHIQYWFSLHSIAESNPSNIYRSSVAELLREARIECLEPDIIHVSSLFEGYAEDGTSSVGKYAPGTPTVVTLYDLIPYLHQEYYFTSKPYEDWYLRRIESLRKAELLFAISEATRTEAIDALNLDGSRIVTIPADADAHFRVIEISKEEEQTLRHTYNLGRDYILYTGGIDYRKNVEKLVEAYSLLPLEYRKKYQLVIVCAITAEQKRQLEDYGRRLGLHKTDLNLTGYLSDDDLVKVYNLCTLFVFPSIHEGFGLPLLEAMRCGKPVIGSDRSSIPEIIGCRAALFNPESSQSIADKMCEALSNKEFMATLERNSQERSTNYSWEKSATRALEAYEEIYRKRNRNKPVYLHDSPDKPVLLYVSPLPPEKSGIADYSAELVPRLEKYYHLILVTDQKRSKLPANLGKYQIVSSRDVLSGIVRFDRILYHFGNSEFHKEMLPLLEKYPGTVVLHDFFLSGLMSHLETGDPQFKTFRKYLYRSHGYPALIAQHQKGIIEATWDFPCNLHVIRDAQGVIVHSHHASDLARNWYGEEVTRYWDYVPLPKQLPERVDKNTARKILGIPNSVFLVCSFGILGKTKKNEDLFEAWSLSSMSKNKNSRLIFVGDGLGSEYENELRDRISDSEDGSKVSITGHVDPDIYRYYLMAADIGVQLRTISRGETSTAVLDCLAYGLATIVNEHGSLAELPDEVVCKVPDKFVNRELSDQLEKLYYSESARQELGRKAKEFIGKHRSPETIALAYADVIEKSATRHPYQSRKLLIESIVGLEPNLTNDDLLQISSAIYDNEALFTPRKLIVDITQFSGVDAKTGIQRVVRSVLKHLLQNPPEGYRVEPVYRKNGSYYYARKFCLEFLGLHELSLDDTRLEVLSGDIFLGLDLILTDEELINSLEYFKQKHVKIYFIVYDVLPILLRDCFPPEAYPLFSKWLKTVVAIADGLIGISRSVVDQLIGLMDSYKGDRHYPIKLGYFHLGSEIALNADALVLTAEENIELDKIGNDAFLMVGTVEPRKGHKIALDAFELLWKNGCESKLVIVGNVGWLVESVVGRILNHSEFGKRLIWLRHVSDGMLDRLYSRAKALLMASEGEGFGLPIVEAAQYALPIIARDLPVFREIAGDNAFYFKAFRGEDLADEIQKWQALHSEDLHPSSSGLKRISWVESVEQLLDVIIKDGWCSTWQADHRNQLQ